MGGKSIGYWSLSIVLTLIIGAARAESTANHGASLANPPAPNGPYEQKTIRPVASTGMPTSQPRTATGISSKAWDMGKMPLALCGVILLIFGMRALGKKMMPGAAGRGSSRAITVLGRSALSPRQQLMLIQVGRRIVLVGSGGSEMRSLCEIGDPDEVAEVLAQIRRERESSVANNFRTLFSRAGREYEEDDADGSPATERSELMPRAELGGLSERVRRISERFGES